MQQNAFDENGARDDPALTGTTLSTKMAALGHCDLAQLRAEWRRLYRGEPPRLSRDLMIRAIAYGMQERARGGLTARTRRRLHQLAERLEAGGEIDRNVGVRLQPGAVLVREWHGRNHTIRVLEDGFEYADRRYRSLTQIAAEITGAHWSGPRFFGLARTETKAGAVGQEDGSHG